MVKLLAKWVPRLPNLAMRGARLAVCASAPHEAMGRFAHGLLWPATDLWPSQAPGWAQGRTAADAAGV